MNRTLSFDPRANLGSISSESSSYLSRTGQHWSWSKEGCLVGFAHNDIGDWRESAIIGLDIPLLTCLSGSPRRKIARDLPLDALHGRPCSCNHDYDLAS